MSVQSHMDVASSDQPPSGQQEPSFMASSTPSVKAGTGFQQGKLYLGIRIKRQEELFG